MNDLTLIMFPAEVETAITNALESLHGTAGVGVQVTYRSARKASYTPSTGQLDRSEGSWFVDAIAEDVKESLVTTTGSKIKVGDRRYLIRREALPVDPKRGDLVIEKDSAMKVIDVDSDAQKILWLITARRSS